MTTPTDQNRDLLTVIAHMRAEPRREQELRVLFDEDDLVLDELERIA